MSPNTTPIELQLLPDHERRMAAARKVASWHLGYPSWADKLVMAYCNPEAAITQLHNQEGYDD